MLLDSGSDRDRGRCRDSAATLASYHQDDAVPQGAAEVDETETGPLARSRGCHISSRCLV
jgi:hypothetical protein